MFRILVADDEDFIRLGIIAMLKRNLPSDMEPKFTEASDGYEAYQIASQSSMDLVITDIRMPGASGLDFIQQLRDICPSAPVIVISGYEDFKYAQRAIQLGVKSYITKPINKQELIDLVLHIFQESQKAALRQTESVQKNIANKAIEQELKESLFLKYFTMQDREEIQALIRKLQKMGVSFHATLFTCVCIQYQSKSPMEFLNFAILNVTQEVLCSLENVHYLGSARTSEHSLVLMISGEETAGFLPRIKFAFSGICEKLIQYYHCDLFIGIGNPVYDTLSVRKSYLNARRAADYKIFDKDRHLQLYSELEKGRPLPEDRAEKIMAAIRTMNGIQIANAFRIFTADPYTRCNMLSFAECYDKFIQVFHQHLAPYQPPEETECVPSSLSGMWSIAQMNQEIFSCLDGLEQIKNTQNAGPANQRLLTEITLYIHEHLTDTLDLNVISQIFDKSPSYISFLFKKGMQEGFNEYVTKERIKLAKEYLKDCSIPINEVSTKCGYVNAKYFSVVFKKVTGESPKDYRFRASKATDTAFKK